MDINPDSTISTLGGKGYQLMQLMQNFNVPPFFVISFEKPDEILDIENQKAILHECQAQKLDLVAVRSSANVEDSEKASFAGMFETALNVPLSKVISAIQHVLESLRNRRVSQYCETQGINKNNIRMNVIVQKMIQSRVSGVCFTQTQKGADQLVIEACYGLGEALVSGSLTPDTYIIDRSTFKLITASIGYQRVELRIDVENPEISAYFELPFHKRNAKKLKMEEIISVAKMSLLVEKQLNFDAADIEWTFEGNNLYLLQARPYTGYM